jgi:hypothetical protein
MYIHIFCNYAVNIFIFLRKFADYKILIPRTISNTLAQPLNKTHHEKLNLTREELYGLSLGEARFTPSRRNEAQTILGGTNKGTKKRQLITKNDNIPSV